MPTKTKPAAKVPKRPLRTELTISLATTVLDNVDALARKAGISRTDTIEMILTACTFQGSAPFPKPPSPCPRGHIRP
ncbi:MAG: hypothetical protein WCK89_21330 [bacterium]